MRTLLLAGVILSALGLGGATMACLESGLFEPDVAVTGSPSPTTTPAEDAPSGAVAMGAIVSGLLLAAGIACLALGAGASWRPRREVRPPGETLPGPPHPPQ